MDDKVIQQIQGFAKLGLDQAKHHWPFLAGGLGVLVAHSVLFGGSPELVQGTKVSPVNPPLSANAVVEASGQNTDQVLVNLVAALNQQRNAVVFETAQRFVARASEFTQQEGHPCYQKTESQCLESFVRNRVYDTRNYAVSETQTVTAYNQILLETSAVLLAQIMIKPDNQRSEAETYTLNFFQAAFSEVDGGDVWDTTINPGSLASLSEAYLASLKIESVNQAQFAGEGQ